MIVRRLGAGLAGPAVALLILLTASPAALAKPAVADAAPRGAAVRPSGAVDFWAWVTLRDPSATVQPVAPWDQGNVFGGTNTVAYLGGGVYHVVFPSVGTGGGVVNLSVLGTKKRVCDVSEWYSDTPVAGVSSEENVFILCWNDSGTPATARFIATFTDSAQPVGRLADLWAGDWTQTHYTPDARWNFNSTGTPNRIHKSGVGDYRVTLPGLASSRGDVQIGNYGRFIPMPFSRTSPGAGSITRTSPGAGSISQTPTECNVASWGPHNADMQVRVLCRDLGGHPIDSQFNLTFTQNEGIKGPNGSDFAYLFANQPGSASYKPLSAFRYASPPAKPHVTRQGVGRYSVSLPSMPKGGGAIVTAYGTGKVRCNVLSIATGGTQQVVGVRCRDFSGHAVDSKFTLSYLN